jgi:hypothetical protein
VAYYQTVEFMFCKRSYYCIWFSAETEGFLSENGNPLIFERCDLTKSFANHNQINLDEEVAVYDVDSIACWADSSDLTVDSVAVLNFWNVIQDITVSANKSFVGNMRTNTVDDLYDKLFCGNNVLIDREDEKYYPVWTPEEIMTIKKIILDGVNTLRKIISLRII